MGGKLHDSIVIHHLNSDACKQYFTLTFIHYLERKSIYQNYTSDVGLITFMKLNLLQI